MTIVTATDNTMAIKRAMPGSHNASTGSRTMFAMGPRPDFSARAGAAASAGMAIVGEVNVVSGRRTSVILQQQKQEQEPTALFLLVSGTPWSGVSKNVIFAFRCRDTENKKKRQRRSDYLCILRFQASSFHCASMCDQHLFTSSIRWSRNCAES